jgi:large subunit ribosomal protein L24
MNIKKGDQVKILRGKDAGKSGKVLKVIRKKNLVLVEEINKVKRHVKKQSTDQPGGIVEIEKPLPVSSVVKIDQIKSKPKTKKTINKTPKKSISKKK